MERGHRPPCMDCRFPVPHMRAKPQTKVLSLHVAFGDAGPSIRQSGPGARVCASLLGELQAQLVPCPLSPKRRAPCWQTGCGLSAARCGPGPAWSQGSWDRATVQGACTWTRLRSGQQPRRVLPQGTPSLSGMRGNRGNYPFHEGQRGEESCPWRGSENDRDHRCE